MTVATVPQQTVPRTRPRAKLITGEELLAMGDIGPCELIDGRIVRMNPTGLQHGDIVIALGSALRDFVRKRQLGAVLVAKLESTPAANLTGFAASTSRLCLESV